MKASKIILYLILFFITLIAFNNAGAIELMSDDIVLSGNYDELGKNKNKSNLSADYNMIFKNDSKHDNLEIKMLGHQCMYKVGDEYINLKPGDKHNENLEDSNYFFQGCSGANKFVKWEVSTYKKGKKYKSCVFRMETYLPSFPGAYLVWQSIVETDGCHLEMTATCNGVNCLNKNINSNTSNNPSNIVITIKDDNNWEPPVIISPKPNATVENNYITISGKGFMEDGGLPTLVTNFNGYTYSVRSTGVAEIWSGQLWINCGIIGTVGIQTMENSDVTFNGPPCGATITSIQNGQTIPAGEYSLSGRVNSDTADNARHMQVQITGYQKDGAIYAPTKRYTPDVDTGTGKWNLGGLEAVCGINYNVSVSTNSLGTSPASQSILPSLIGSNISYHTPDCPFAITKPKNYEIVSSTTGDIQDISIGGRAIDGTIVVINVKSLGSQDDPGQSFNGNIVDNKWSIEAKGVPIGIIKIRADNSETAEVPIQNSSAEVTVLSSKIFSVEAKNNNVFTEFYGTSMPYIYAHDEGLETVVQISLNGIELDEIDPDTMGNWKDKVKYYARRGIYIFTFQEDANNPNYTSRDKKIFKCTGGDRGMTCVNHE
ncbi:hypothetical protein L7G72_14575 [Xenorhabdus bovienii]|uniref:hypothetical protein n=1 Tax=Xenorhabdus bovienii TaxID=40576 RepID=UPI001EDE4EF6|nr:hypothetical protein [Xenorhabdus bovienii]MCG3463049.1 hypothetical protein [Xenorhabdus bovienii]